MKTPLLSIYELNSVSFTLSPTLNCTVFKKVDITVFALLSPSPSILELVSATISMFNASFWSSIEIFLMVTD